MRAAARLSTAALILLAMAGTPIMAQGTSAQDDIRAAARAFGAAKYYLGKGEADRAQDYLRSMELMLRTVEAQHGAQAAEEVFRRATGATTSRLAFFRSMGVTSRDGSMERPKSRRDAEIRPRVLDCGRDVNGEILCAAPRD